MRIVYTDHALKQLKERRMTINEVESTLIQPDIVTRQNGKSIAVRLMQNWFAHVVFKRENDKYIVITTWKSRKWKHGRY